MKNKLLLLALLVFAFAKAQVSTSSATPTAAEPVTILFNAVGTPLENSTQTLHLYAGVTIQGVQMGFQKVKGDFFSNNPAINPTFTRASGTNSYQITLGPSLNQYFNVNLGTEIITAIDLVIRNANGPNGSPGSANNKPIQTADFKLPIFQPGLNAVITSPADGQIYAVNQQITIAGSSSQTAALEISVNGSSIATATASTISSPYTFSSPGNYSISFTAVNGNQTATDNKNIFVPAPTINEPRPAGLKNGVNENTDGSVTFLLAAPLKNSVTLLGSFSNWALNTGYQMKKDGDYFWLTVPASVFTANTVFSYQYLVDSTIKVADPFSTLILDPQNDQFIKAGNYPNLPSYPTGLTTGDVTIYTYKKVPYVWNVTDFQRPDNENLVIYELHVRDFSESDSFQGVIDKIDYIKDLGVNAVEFMPLNEFGGNDSWGYDVKYHGALDKAYGPANKFKELVDLLHANGIAVILDVVYNQVLEDGPLVRLWPSTNGNGPGSNNPYTNVTAPHRVLEFFIDMNHESPWTKEYVKQTTQYFLEEFKIDGFRFDLSKGFTQKQTTGFEDWGRRDNSRIAILNDYKSFLLANNDSDIYLILEHLADNDEEKVLADGGFMLWGNIHGSYKQSALGYPSGADVFRTYYTSRSFNNQHLVAYAESHDEERLVYESLQNGNTDNFNHNVKTLPVALGRQEAIASILYSIPGPKMLWQFGELGYDISINQNGRTGRKPIPFTNGYASNTDRLDLYRVTGELIKLKTKYPETFNTTNNNLEVSGLVKRIQLNGPNFDVVVVANLDVTSKTVTPRFTQTGLWYDFFAGNSSTVTDPNQTITLAPGAYKIYSTQQLSTTASTVNFDTEKTLQLYPNPANDSFSVNGDVSNLTIFNSLGQMVKSFEANQGNYNVSDLVPGIYIVKIMGQDGNRSSMKLLKN